GRRNRREVLALACLAAAAVAVLALPPRPSFQTLAARRPADQGRADPLTFVLPPEQRSLTDWVRLLRSQPDPRQHAGDPVRLSGFLMPVPDDHPQLSRLLVRCCLADATPVGLPLRWRGPLPGGSGDHWLAVEGHLVSEMHRGEARLAVEPSRIRQIPRPARPLEP
ncbi:MAG: TIGR03943 family protein, partial [Prochlorococcaceae cyanobacterium]